MVRRPALLLALNMVLCTAFAQNSHDARILAYEGIGFVCDGEVIPRLKIVNDGSTTMFTCVVETWKNGLQLNSFDWVLAVAALQGDVREPVLPPVEALAGDVVEFRIISVNEVPDQGTEGNMFSTVMADVIASADNVVVLVEALTDATPEETTWSIHDGTGAMVAHGGPYDQADTVYEHWLTLTASSCCELRVQDAGGNGSATGHVQLKSAGQTVLDLGGNGPIGEVRAGFVTGTAVGIPENKSETLLVHPNPTSGLLHMAVLPGRDQGSPVQLVDDAGRLVMTTTIAVGAGTVVLDLSGLPSGRYTLSTGSENGPRSRASVIRQ